MDRLEVNSNIDNMNGKNVLVVGLGRSGIAAAQALSKLGAEVSVQDNKKEESVDPALRSFLKTNGIECYFDRLPSDFSKFHMMVLSPGVNPHLYWVEDAIKSGVEIVGELEIAYRIGKGNYIAITGTNGKTTTTTLVGEIFRRAKRKTSVVGNIGVAVISASVDAEEDDWLITEVSSFQLETSKYFSPKVSAILNLTPDHLDRHGNMKIYGEAKEKITLNQREDDYLVVNKDNKEAFQLSKRTKAMVMPFSRTEMLKQGSFVKDGFIVFIDENDKEVQLVKTTELQILGDHNLENALAATGIALCAGIDAEVVRECLRTFSGVEHRIEFSGEIDRVRYYNDSKGTNTDAAITALKALEKDIHLIAGGDGKSQDFSPLAKELSSRVKTLILLGRDAAIIEAAAREQGFENIVFVKDMEEAVRVAHDKGKSGDKVLLSPACASWDMYENFEQRGRHFKECVNRVWE